MFNFSQRLPQRFFKTLHSVTFLLQLVSQYFCWAANKNQFAIWKKFPVSTQRPNDCEGRNVAQLCNTCDYDTRTLKINSLQDKLQNKNITSPLNLCNWLPLTSFTLVFKITQPGQKIAWGVKCQFYGEVEFGLNFKFGELLSIHIICVFCIRLLRILFKKNQRNVFCNIISNLKSQQYCYSLAYKCTYAWYSASLIDIWAKAIFAKGYVYVAGVSKFFQIARFNIMFSAQASWLG